MSPEQQELFRKALLRVLDANRTRFGLGAPALGHLVVQFGFPSPKPEDIEEQLDYLTQKGLVAEVLKQVSRENRCWRITKEGLAFIDSQI